MTTFLVIHSITLTRKVVKIFFCHLRILFPPCHPERSEGSSSSLRQPCKKMLRRPRAPQHDRNTERTCRPTKNHRFRRFHRIPSSAEDGTKSDFVIFGDMCLENDTSHAGQGDFCASNRALACMQSLCRKRPLAFFDKLVPPHEKRAALFPKGGPLKAGNFLFCFRTPRCPQYGDGAARPGCWTRR